MLASSATLAFAAEKGAPVDRLLQDMKPAAGKPAAEKRQGLSLRAALAETYARNPALEAARAELRAVDETYSQAVSGFRPSVSGDASYISTHTDAGAVAAGADPKVIELEVTQPLYRGGSTVASVKRSESVIKAQRALLHVTEQQILLNAVTAFMDVLRDQQLLDLNLNNEKVLRNHLEASRQRFKLGDVTRTDVSQSESRLADAVADRVAAEGQLKKSRAAFESVIGLPPDNLEAPAVNLPLPASLEQALAEADTKNPAIIYAHYITVAAEAGTRSISGELLPQIDLTGGIGRTYDTAGGASRADDTSLALRATIPIFSGGGSVYSRIRQARQVEEQRKMETRDTLRGVRENVIEAWEELASARAERDARLAQIEAAKTALEGVQLERDYGSRTTLDLLDAEQEYLDAQTAHVTAERDHVVAAYGLLAAVGQMTATGLALDTAVYDPDKNFQNIKNKWFGAKIERAE